MTNPLILPKRLRPGDQVALIAPAFQATAEQVREAILRLESFDLEVVNTVSFQQNDGYFSSSAEAMVATLHELFSNPQIKALVGVRGGYGCARLLPLLDWDLIKANPKIVMGFSDMTALLIAIHQKTGLITFHGPGASMPWPPFTRDFLHQILFAGTTKYFNPPEAPDKLINILHGGSATGELIGGNLSVLSSLVGSPYLPQNWHNKILFLEDVHEEVYRLDRLLTHLKLAHILGQIKGLILGQFNRCTAQIPQSFSVMELLTRVAKDLNIPVLANVTFGHQPEMLTFPIGATVRVDADQGRIELLSPALQ